MATITNSRRVLRTKAVQDRYFRRDGESLSSNLDLRKSDKIVWREGLQGEVYITYDGTKAGFFLPNSQGVTGWYITSGGMNIEYDGSLDGIWPLDKAAWVDLVDGGVQSGRHTHP